MRRLVLVATAIALAVPQAAHAYRLGALDPHPSDQKGCGYEGALYIDDEAPGDQPGPAGRPRGQIPPGGGTITSFTTGVRPKGLRIRLALVRQVNKPRDGVIIERRTKAHTIKRDSGYSTFPADLKAKAGELIALDVIANHVIPLDCFFAVPRDDFIWVTGDKPDPGMGRFAQYTSGDGYDHSRIDLKAHLVRHHH